MADEPKLSAKEDRAPRTVRVAMKVSRGLILVGIAAVFVAGSLMLLYSAFEAVAMAVRLVVPGGEMAGKDAIMLTGIKLVDLVLLATVLYIVAAGLYELFIDSDLDLPPWLKIEDIDDLKHKLIGVVITVIGVVFMGNILSWKGEGSILQLGIGVAAVVLALSYFLDRQRQKK